MNILKKRFYKDLVSVSSLFLILILCFLPVIHIQDKTWSNWTWTYWDLTFIGMFIFSVTMIYFILGYKESYYIRLTYIKGKSKKLQDNIYESIEFNDTFIKSLEEEFPYDNIGEIHLDIKKCISYKNLLWLQEYNDNKDKIIYEIPNLIARLSDIQENKINFTNFSASLFNINQRSIEWDYIKNVEMYADCIIANLNEDSNIYFVIKEKAKLKGKRKKAHLEIMKMPYSEFKTYFDYEQFLKQVGKFRYYEK